MTAIEWTDTDSPIEPSFCQGQPLDEGRVPLAAPGDIVQPVFCFCCALSTVARDAARNDIPWGSAPSPADGDNVIPATSPLRTIGAAVSEEGHQILLGLGRYRLNVALPCVRTLLSVVAIPLVRLVAGSLIGASVFAAQPTAHIGCSTPAATPPAPVETEAGPEGPALDERWAWRNSCASAVSADVGVSTGSAAINREGRNRLGFSTLRASLHAVAG